jgi:hypothetical protein
MVTRGLLGIYSRCSRIDPLYTRPCVIYFIDMHMQYKLEENVFMLVGYEFYIISYVS